MSISARLGIAMLPCGSYGIGDWRVTSLVARGHSLAIKETDPNYSKQGCIGCIVVILVCGLIGAVCGFVLSDDESNLDNIISETDWTTEELRIQDAILTACFRDMSPELRAAAWAAVRDKSDHELWVLSRISFVIACVEDGYVAP